MFSCEFHEIFKNTFFTEHLMVTGSKDQLPKSIIIFSAIPSEHFWLKITKWQNHEIQIQNFQLIHLTR